MGRSKLEPPASDQHATGRRARRRRLGTQADDGHIRPRSLISAFAGSTAAETLEAREPTPHDRDELRRTLMVLPGGGRAMPGLREDLVVAGGKAVLPGLTTCASPSRCRS